MKIYTTTELAKRFGCSRQWILKLVTNKKIKPLRGDSTFYVFNESEVIKYEKERNYEGD